jgi:DNA-binding transcriptional ArsR family regulator
MKAGPDIAMVAALVGDPARSNMLTALMTGRALTASELAQEAGITPQTASSHLSKLEAGGLIEPEKQGRHQRIQRCAVRGSATTTSPATSACRCSTA